MLWSSSLLIESKLWNAECHCHEQGPDGISNVMSTQRPNSSAYSKLALETSTFQSGTIDTADGSILMTPIFQVVLENIIHVSTNTKTVSLDGCIFLKVTVHLSLKHSSLLKTVGTGFSELALQYTNINLIKGSIRCKSTPLKSAFNLPTLPREW